jgi:phosphohistidine phosphatase
MLRLTLFRHAKSSWDAADLSDFDRPLAARGETAVPVMAAHLAQKKCVPGLILCSSARRTRQTLDLAIPYWKPRPKIEYLDALYHATAQEMTAILREAPAKAKHVMIVGHNPGLQSLAIHLIGAGEPSERRAIARKFPTAGVAVIVFDAKSWAELQAGRGQLMIFATPKQLLRKE